MYSNAVHILFFTVYLYIRKRGNMFYRIKISYLTYKIKYLVRKVTI